MSTPNVRPRCDCGKPATVEIMASGNVRYGHACDRCAPKRIKQLDRDHNGPASNA